MCGLLSFLIYARQLNESFRLKYIMNHDVIYECQQKKSKWDSYMPRFASAMALTSKLRY